MLSLCLVPHERAICHYCVASLRRLFSYWHTHMCQPDTERCQKLLPFVALFFSPITIEENLGPLPCQVLLASFSRLHRRSPNVERYQGPLPLLALLFSPTTMEGNLGPLPCQVLLASFSCSHKVAEQREISGALALPGFDFLS